MGINSNTSSVHVVKVLLVVGLLSLGSVVCAQTTEKSSGVNHTPVASQVLPDDPGRSLTAIVVELAPGAKSASHHHAGIVFAYVLEGTVRLQLNDGEVIVYRAGQYWVEPLDRSFEVLKSGGVLVSSVAVPDQYKAAQHRVRGVFFLVAVTSEGLTRIADLLDSGQLTPNVDEVLPLAEARLANEMLAGKPHKRGKIVLAIDA